MNLYKLFDTKHKATYLVKAKSYDVAISKMQRLPLNTKISDWEISKLDMVGSDVYFINQDVAQVTLNFYVCFYFTDTEIETYIITAHTENKAMQMALDYKVDSKFNDWSISRTIDIDSEMVDYVNSRLR